MKLKNLRVRNLTEPIGYAMDAPVFSWTVEDCAGSQLWASLTLSTGGKIVFDTGTVHDADSLGWKIDLKLRPRTRYDYTLTVCAADGEKASAHSFFETGKRDEPWHGQWISPRVQKTSALLEKRFTAASLAANSAALCGMSRTFLGTEIWASE